MQEEKKKTIFSPNRIVAIIFYILILFIGAGVVTIVLGVILGAKQGLDIETVISSFTAADLTEYEQPYIRVNALAQGWGNFIGYLLAFLLVGFYMRDDVVTDFRALGEDKKFNSIFIPLAAIGFVGITYIIDILVSIGVESSVNQSTIEAIIQNGGAVPMVIATVLFAPIVEELIYRKAIFSLCKKYGVVACYVLSTIFFTLPHMLSSDMSNIGVWLLQCIPYATSGILLCVIYHKSKYNLYAAIAAHMANNLLAGIMILVSSSAQ